MADEIRISSNARRVLAAFDGLPKRIQEGIKAGLIRGLLLVEDRVRRRTKVKSRRGAAGLMGRLTSKVMVEGSGRLSIDGLIGFRKTRGFPYELAQEYGAKAKAGKAMAIPVTPQARRTSSPREFPGELVIPGSRWLAGATKGYSGRTVGVLGEPTARGLLRVHYVLVKSIPPRLRFGETVRASGKLISREALRGMKSAT